MKTNCSMTKHHTFLKFVAILNLLTMIISLFSLVPVYADAEEGETSADFIMTGEYLNVTAADVIEKGTFAYDESQFIRGPVLVAPNTDGTPMYVGQFFNHSGKGDSYTFTVDFGNHQVDRLGFLYGGGGCTMTLEVYNGDTLVGSQSAGASGFINGESYNNAPECILTFNTFLTGFCTLTIVNAENNAAWPGTDYGYFVFYQEGAEKGGYRKQQLALEKENDKINNTWEDVNFEPSCTFEVKGRETVVGAADILKQEDSVYRKPTMFDAAGHDVASNTAEDEAYDGKFFIHAGMGDRFFFCLDLGNYEAEAMGFLQYGASLTPTVFELYADGKLLGTGSANGGNGWELEDYMDATYNEIIFPEKLHGVVEIEIRIISSSPSWPANNIGYFTFYSNKNQNDVGDTSPESDSDTEPTTEVTTDSATELITGVETDPVTHPDEETQADTNTLIPEDSATASDTSEGETASGCRGTIAGAGGMITLFVSVLAALTLRRKKESYDA